MVLLLDLGDPRGCDAKELRDVANRESSRPEFGDRGRGPASGSVAEFGQGTPQLEGFKGLVGYLDLTEVWRDVYLDVVDVGVEDERDRLADRGIRLVETARL